ncbi:MAG: ribonuclease D [Xanthomonadaceae bacterium]|nr:ribonuclease D [Xanthomonadaceae bacterium]
MPQTLWINQPSELEQRLEHMPERIGLDTEFIRERTFWPKLALVQMALEDQILLIDPLVPGMAQALSRWLSLPQTLKIMHSASEDLVAFKHSCGVLPSPLYDTQVAATLAGIAPSPSYQKLVETTVGALIPKGETRSDWMRRPLSPAQLEYAADDVRYLFDLHDTTARQLDILGRSAWLAEDCERMLHNAEQDESEQWPHLSMRSAQFLDQPAQARLLRLLRWRDSQARGNDKPRNWILDNELAVSLARQPPADYSALQRKLESTPKAPRKLARNIWNAMTAAVPDEAGMPFVRAASDAEKITLKRLQQRVSERSAELGLPVGVLASRRQLETLIEQGQWPKALGQWRREELETSLRPALASAPQDG